MPTYEAAQLFGQVRCCLLLCAASRRLVAATHALRCPIFMRVTPALATARREVRSCPVHLSLWTDVSSLHQGLHLPSR